MSEPAVTQRPAVIGAGTCIMESIIGHLKGVPGLADKADLHLSQATGGGRPPISPELLGRARILIEESAPWQGSATLTPAERSHLPADCTTITVPGLYFNSLWPLMVEDPRNQPEPKALYGRLPFGMGDRLALKLVQTLPLGERRGAYDAIDVLKQVNLPRSHELEMRNSFQREAGCDVRVAAFVMANFREKRLFFTNGHPTGELMYFVLAQLLAIPALRDLIKLPYDQLIVAARHWADTSGVFKGEEAPIHPAVAAYFGLKWWTPELRYAWLGETRNFSEWMDFYLSYQPPGAEQAAPAAPAASVAAPPPVAPTPASGPAANPIPREIGVGAFLSALRGSGGLSSTATLLPASAQTRVEPFASSPIDDTVAPFGYMFADSASRSYQLGEVFIGSMLNATVLGVDGLILRDGAILGDTFRNLPSGPRASLIDSVQRDKLVLQADKVVTRRHLPGRSFCGFAGLWYDDGHWVLGNLPRLVAFKLLQKHVPEVRLIVPSFVPQSRQAETLQMLGIAPESIVEIGMTEALDCDELFCTTAFDLWSVQPVSRMAAQHFAVAAMGPEPAYDPAGEKLFVPGSGSGLSNRPAVHAWLERQGFRTVDLDGMTMRERVELFRKAAMVVGEHGPGLANLFFVPSGTKVLELFAPDQPQPMYWSVASVCGLPYGYLVAGPNGIDLDALVRALDTMQAGSPVAA
jgi:hypothetical protein